MTQKEFYENAYYCRGKLIDHFNILEKSIEEYIVTYMKVPQDRGVDFMTIVLDRLTFQSKMDCFVSITKSKAVKSGFIKTNNAKWPQKDLYMLLQQAKDERNRFAHFYLFYPVKIVDEIIALVEFRDGGTVHAYNQEKYDQILVDIATATALLNELIDEL